MNGKVIAIDIDQTLIPTQSMWNEWKKENPHKDKMDFWRNPFFYDNLVPVPYSVETIRRLSVKNKIFLVSKSFEEHLESKIRFVLKYFVGVSFINTKYKNVILCDVLIDDYTKNLDLMSEKTICFKADIEGTKGDGYDVVKWKNIENYLEGKFNVWTEQ